MYDFNLLRAKVSPVLSTLPLAVANNVYIPTDEEMVETLRIFITAHERIHGAAYIAALREQMIEYAPLTDRQETAKEKGQKVRWRFILTEIGQRYLDDLDRPVDLVVDGHWAANPVWDALESVIEFIEYEDHLNYQAEVFRFHRQIKIGCCVTELQPCLS